jgi:predicted secreted hydrolase
MCSRDLLDRFITASTCLVISMKIIFFKDNNLILCVTLMLLFLSQTTLADETSGYLSVTGPCNLEFPKDHGAHPGYRTEWWYYTGNLRSESGNLYGFQLTFFRRQITPFGVEKKWPNTPSAWRTHQIYLAHAAITDITGGQHLQAEGIARSVLGIAGVFQQKEITRIFLKNWMARISPSAHRLQVTANAFSYDLILNPEKPPVMHGQHGYSLKGSTPDRASCYYSLTRLGAKGSLSVGEKTMEVNGLAWMDHEFSTAPLEPGLVGWDWFGLQLSDGSEVMAYMLRKADGSISRASEGTFIDRSGKSRRLHKEDIKITVLDTWKSSRSNTHYPARWRMRILPLSMNLIIAPNLSDQEMRTFESTGVTYWEGSVDVSGTAESRGIEGKGYVELTGYARPFDAPL